VRRIQRGPEHDDQPWSPSSLFDGLRRLQLSRETFKTSSPKPFTALPHRLEQQARLHSFGTGPSLVLASHLISID
jgi:hypothetical protein